MKECDKRVRYKIQVRNFIFNTGPLGMLRTKHFKRFNVERLVKEKTVTRL